MKGSGGRERRTLLAAERVHDVLEAQGVESAVIGAMALAVRGYVRSTRDFDLATHTDPFGKLPQVRRALQEAGLQSELRTPDADDPLGGVLEVTGQGFKPIQIVNFLNPLAPRVTAVGREAIERAEAGLISQSRMRVVTLPHLVALKLYAGGAKSRNDVIEVLERNRPLDLGQVREVCARHGLGSDLEKIVAEIGLQGP